MARDGSAFYRGSVSPSQPAGECHPQEGPHLAPRGCDGDRAAQRAGLVSVLSSAQRALTESGLRTRRCGPATALLLGGGVPAPHSRPSRSLASHQGGWWWSFRALYTPCPSQGGPAEAHFTLATLATLGGTDQAGLFLAGHPDSIRRRKVVPGAPLPSTQADGLGQRLCTAAERLAVHHVQSRAPPCPLCPCRPPSGTRHGRGWAVCRAGAAHTRPQHTCVVRRVWGRRQAHACELQRRHVLLGAWGLKSPTSLCRRLLVPHPVSSQTEVEAGVCGPDVRVRCGRERQVVPGPQWSPGVGVP